MRAKTLIVGAAAASLAAVPITAQAASRPAAPATGDSRLAGPDSLTQLIVLALVAAAIIGGIALFDDGSPASP